MRTHNGSPVRFMVLGLLIALLPACESPPAPVMQLSPWPESTRIPYDPMDYGIAYSSGPEGSLYQLTGDGLRAVMFSPDGSILLSRISYARDGKILVFNSADGCLYNIIGYNGEGPVTMSPDGRMLVYADESVDEHFIVTEMIKLHEPFADDPFRTIDAVSDRIAELGFAPSGDFLFSSGGGYIKIWDTSSWNELQSLEGEPLYVNPDGTLLVTRQTIKNTTEVWSTYDWRSVCHINAAAAAVSWDGGVMAQTRDGRVGEAAYIDFWNLQTCKAAGSVEIGLAEEGGYLRYVRFESLSFRPHSGTLGFLSDVIPVQMGNFTLIDIETGATQYQRLGDVATSMSFSPAGDVLALGMESGKIILMHGDTGQFFCELDGHGGPIGNLLFSADGTRLASDIETDNLLAGEIILWDVANCR